MFKDDNGNYVDIDKYTVTIDDHVLDYQYLWKIHNYFQTMATAEYLLENYKEDYNMTEKEAWFAAGEIRGDMDKYGVTEEYAIDEGLEKYLNVYRKAMADKKKTIAENSQKLVAAGDWHFKADISEIKEGKDLDFGDVYLGNNQIIFRTYRAGNDLFVAYTKMDPMKGFNFNMEDVPQELHILGKHKPDYAMLIHHYSEVNTEGFLELTPEMLESLDSFKSHVMYELAEQGVVNYNQVETYKKIKDSGLGFFQQLSREIEEYPSKLASQEKLSVEDIYLMRKHYMSFGHNEKNGPAVVKKMVEDGFKNPQINLICKEIQKFNEGFGGGVEIKLEMYSDETVNKIRNELKQEVKAIAQQK